MFKRLVADGTLELLPDDAEWFGRLVDTLFFASLMVEEGEPVRIAIVHEEDGALSLEKMRDESAFNEESPELAWSVTRIPAQPFDAATLAKLSRGIEYGTQVVVVGGREELRIEGIARRKRGTDGGSATRIAAPRPGVLVFEQHERQVLRYEAGGQVRSASNVFGKGGPMHAAMSAICGGPYSPHAVHTVRRLVQRMRTTESGAILAMLPHEPSPALLRATRYGREDPGELMKRVEVDHTRVIEWANAMMGMNFKRPTPKQVSRRESAREARDLAHEELETTIADVARMSAIDGAVLAGPNLAIYGAGCVLPSTPLAPEVVRRALDIDANQTEQYPNRHGARHRAAFSFVFENPGAVAFVVSEDGPVSCATCLEKRVVVWSVEVLET